MPDGAPIYEDGQIIGWASRIEFGAGVTIAFANGKATVTAAAGGPGGPHPDLSEHEELGLITEDDLDAHELAEDPHPLYARDADLTSHAGAFDPHPAYQRASEKGVANGYPSLNASGDVPDDQIAASVARTSQLHEENHAARHAAGQADPVTPAAIGAEVAGAVATHAAAVDPHPAYAYDAELNAHAADTTAVHGIVDSDALILEGDPRLSNARTPTTHTHLDADLPAEITRDAELTSAINAHAATPHGTAIDYAEAGDLAASAFGDTALAGVSEEVPRADHRHAREANPVTAHEAAGDPHPGYLTAAEGAAAFELAGAVATHAGASDPHTGYQRESEKGAANGYPSLGADALVPQDQLGSGAQDGTRFLRDDGVWAAPPGGSAGAAPSQGVYAPGAFTVPDGGFGFIVSELILNGTEEATLNGDAELYIA